MKTLSLLLGLAPCLIAAPAWSKTVAQLQFDGTQQTLTEIQTGQRLEVKGVVLAVDSPVGPAIRLDGNTSFIASGPLPRLTGGQPWTLSAWIKLDAWPWNDTPIVDQQADGATLFFGIDPFGHLIARRQQGGGPDSGIISDVALIPRAWTLVTLSYDGRQLAIGVNGKAARASAWTPPSAPMTTARLEPLIIGHTRAPALPYPANAIHPLLPIDFALDGALAGITIHDHSLSPGEMAGLMKGISPSLLAQAPATPLPRWTGGPGPFGAFRTTLSYDPIWDKPRRIGPDNDVVVRFPGSPIQLIFWQGMNYIPAWVTENGRWYSDEFMEIYGKPRCPDGEDCEPMSDRQARYSHVDILESSPARAVIHWRYALSEVENQKLADAADPSHWGAWADEYWTVYPDGSAIRKSVLWTDHPEREGSEFQETIVIVPAGQTPEDNIHPDAIAIANLKGEQKSFRWAQRSPGGLAKPRGPETLDGIDDPAIQWVNLRSEWKPFQVAGGGPVKITGINWEPSTSSFEWWNHWPVAQIRSSGRPALTSDRPSHSSLSHVKWPIAEKDDKRIVKLLMSGLTTQSAAELAPKARSWLNAPAARADGGAVATFDRAERAYRVSGAAGGAPIRIEIAASAERPLINPAFVVDGWTGNASVTVSGTAGSTPVIPQLGYVDRLDGRRLVAYLPMTAQGPVTIVLQPEP